MVPVVWYFTVCKGAPFRLRLSCCRPDARLMGRILTLGLASFVMQVASTVVSLSLIHISARILQAARFAAGRNDVEFVMLYSFGCGLDAVTVDQVRAVLKERGSALTALKIDEMVDLAATRIRVRSMVAAREERLARGGAR